MYKYSLLSLLLTSHTVDCGAPVNSRRICLALLSLNATYRCESSVYLAGDKVVVNFNVGRVTFALLSNGKHNFGCIQTDMKEGDSMSLTLQ